MSARWPFARTADQPATRPDRLLRDNPVLLLSALQAPGTVSGLVAAWNPGWQPERRAEQRPGMTVPGPAPQPPGSEAVPHPTRAEAADRAAPALPAPAPLAEGIRWHGPLRLTPMLRADAGLPTAGPAASLGLAYVAEVRRARTKIVDSRHADLLRLRYPQGLPTGPEADAWHLVRGLAKRLRGVARLPGGPIHAPHEDPALPGDADHAVFSHEMLPWIVLREILRPIAPDLVREVVPDGGGYILRQRDLLEVRVSPAGPESRWPSARLPLALRQRADAAWPRSVYEFCDASPLVPRAAAPRAHPAQAVRAAAALIAEVTGGIHLDADGFPEETRTFTTR
ncbi:hypothetical protein KGQ19_48060 [Catenulispora sp. NL8]|uniref:Uncharacterized protein n=1 Tax=Catenulispora pinistramenti TaxID=2705254 RepID=A0ABS5L8E6_9ACTN|nr:hypothetical protein [Catenulispora pinistramenti]MBS2554636.1 hypothetical protein [Catenulispora pinistramenti]